MCVLCVCVLCVCQTSQKGDWDNFRNEYLTSACRHGDYADPKSGDPLYINRTKFNIEDSVEEPLPPHGVLECDYASTDVAHRAAGVSAMPESVFAQLELGLKSVWGAIVSRKAFADSQVWQQQALQDCERTILRHRKSAKTIARQAQVGATATAAPGVGSEKECSPHIAYRRKHRLHCRMHKNDHLALLPPVVAAAVLIQSACRGCLSRRQFRVARACARECATLRAQTTRMVRLRAASDQKQLTKVRQRQRDMQTEHTTSRRHMLGRVASLLDESLGNIAGEDETSTVSVTADADITTRNLAKEQQLVSDAIMRMRHRREPARRECWWLPAPSGDQWLARDQQQRAQAVATRQVLMMRRSTMEFHWSVGQLRRALLLVPPCGHVEAVVAVFAKIVDPEKLKLRDLLTEVSDANAAKAVNVSDQHVSVNRRMADLQERLGAANMFNPIRCEGQYLLNLRNADERRVAECLVGLCGKRVFLSCTRPFD
jgi:hypothetical protein